MVSFQMFRFALRNQLSVKAEKKRFTSLFLLLCLFLQSAGVIALVPSAPQLAAKSYILIDAANGEVLVENQADYSVPPASLTKIMTAYIVFSEIRNGSIAVDDLVTISDNAWRKGGSASGGSTMFLEPRSQVKIIDLLHGLVIQSGNDAAIALAEHVAGSEEAFAELMNQQAYLLGLTGTYFENATGLDAETHQATARDLSKLAVSLIKEFPEYYALYSKKQFKFNGIRQDNRNGLLWKDKSVDGIKTGYTKDAGWCLVTSAERNGMRLVSVVLGAKSAKGREQETQKLLSYGFRYFETLRLYDDQTVLTQAKLWGGTQETVGLTLEEPLILTIPRGKKTALEASMEIDREIVAPVKAGDSHGVLKVRLDGHLIERKALVVRQAVDRSGLFSRLWDQLLLKAQSLIGFDSTESLPAPE